MLELDSRDRPGIRRNRRADVDLVQGPQSCLRCRLGFRKQGDEARRVDDADLVRDDLELGEGAVELVAFQDIAQRLRASRQRVAALCLPRTIPSVDSPMSSGFMIS
jgi:hypothetical protein